MGRIVKPFGVRGEVIVDPTGEDPARFARGERLFVEPVGDEALEVSVSRFRTGNVTVTFAGIEDRDQAEDLVGTVLHQDIDKLPPLPEGAFYHFQLVGLTVVRDDGTDLGEVLRVHELPASDVLEVRGPDCEWMIPRRDDVIASVDLEAGRIFLLPCDDLLEAVGHLRVAKESPGKIRRRAREQARQRAWEIREAKREEQRLLEAREATDREARELDVDTWNAGSGRPSREPSGADSKDDTEA